ncbi:MAG: ATP-binding protein [Chloroflexi bacterium]|nr:ATP-binding protein [Chloroflexota bacterium]OJW05569.1 MAG: hypothetical protein BGO39_02835 [Chloroflexi bacterium 54-19]
MDAYRPIDFKFIRGQEHAKRAIEVALAGKHSLMLWGQPSIGKTTMGLAAYDMFTNDLGQLNFELAEDLADDAVVKTAKTEIDSLNPNAHQVMVTSKPCPCGYFGDSHRVCNCSPDDFQHFFSPAARDLVKAALIHVELPMLDYEKLSSNRLGETSKAIAARIRRAWAAQGHRYGFRYSLEYLTNKGIDQDSPKGVNLLAVPKIFNQALTIEQVTTGTEFTLDSPATAILKAACRQLAFTPRAYFDILKLGRTIADLGESKRIQASHLAEAIQYRRREVEDLENQAKRDRDLDRVMEEQKEKVAGK